MAKEFRKTLTQVVKHAAKNPIIRTAAQEALAAVMTASASFISTRINGQKNSAPDLLHAQDDLIDSQIEDVEEDPGMATLGEVQDTINRVERLTVVFVYPKSGRDVRDDRRGFTPYPFVNKINDDLTVSDLIRRRFGDYERHGLKAVIKDYDNNIVHGGTRVREVRRTFLNGK